MKRIPYFFVFVIVSLVLASCNLGAPAPQDGAAISTAAAQTIEAVLSPAASPTAASSAGENLAGTPTASGVAIDGTTAEPAQCEDIAQIVKWERNFVPFDKTEADKPLEPGKSFSLSLELKNIGTCTWTHEYRVEYSSGERLHIGPDIFPFVQTGFKINPGDSYPLNVQFYAPSKPGSYDSTYSVINAQGKAFLTFGVPTKSGSANSNTANLAAPGNLVYAYDCSSGSINVTLTWSDKADNEDGYRIYRDGTKINELPADTTSYTDTLPASGSYEYTIAAFNAGGESSNKLPVQTSNCQ